MPFRNSGPSIFVLARIALVVGVGLTMSAVAVVAYATDLFDSLESKTVDVRYRIRGDRDPPRDVVIVKIDRRALADLGNWPFQRRAHARVIDEILEDRPAAVAYGVMFAEPGVTHRDDAALQDAIRRANGKVVLAFSDVNARGEPDVFGGGSQLRELDAPVGHSLIPPEPGSVTRRLPFSIDRLRTFAVATAETAGNRPVAREDFDDRGAWIDYAGPPGTYRSVSFSDVHRGRRPRGLFTGKIVVVGATARELYDFHRTPIAGKYMSGSELQANAIQTVRRGLPLKSGSTALAVLVILAMGLAVPVAGLALGRLATFNLALAVAVLYPVGAQLAFNAGSVLPVTYPLLSLAGGSLLSIPVRAVTGAFERARERFSRFVPAPIVDSVLSTRSSPIPGGVRVEATVMFSDVRGFTSFAEQLPAERVIQILNRYHSEMAEAILDGGGTVTSYMGDGIMAVFGAPTPSADHADHALAAAREMSTASLDRFNRWLAREGVPGEFRIGIGINSGPVVSGIVGSERRLEYAAIGDTTNTAARLEGMTKGTPHSVLLSEKTHELLSESRQDLVLIGQQPIRGRQGTVRVWGLTDGSHPANSGRRPEGG